MKQRESEERWVEVGICTSMVMINLQVSCLLLRSRTGFWVQIDRLVWVYSATGGGLSRLAFGVG